MNIEDIILEERLKSVLLKKWNSVGQDTCLNIATNPNMKIIMEVLREVYFLGKIDEQNTPKESIECKCCKCFNIY